MYQQLLQDVGDSALFAFTVFALGVVLLGLHHFIVPGYKLWAEVQRGNAAVALAAGGQMIGLGLVAWSSISHNDLLVPCLIWIGVGSLMQMAAFVLFEILTPKLDVGKELARGNMGVAIISFSSSVAMGLVIAASIS